MEATLRDRRNSVTNSSRDGKVDSSRASFEVSVVIKTAMAREMLAAISISSSWVGSGTKSVYRQSTTPVGSFPPNGWGLYDMHGNAQEWCQDRYGSYKRDPEVDPRGPKSGLPHVMRGGSWNLNPCYCRSAYRGGFNPERRYLNYGFRVVCEVPK